MIYNLSEKHITPILHEIPENMVSQSVDSQELIC